MTDEVAFSVAYKGSTIDFYECDRGYRYKCPKGCCRSWHWIDTETGERHRITSAPGAPVTIVASLLCPCRGGSCGWHVFVTEGVARDC